MLTSLLSLGKCRGQSRSDSRVAEMIVVNEANNKRFLTIAYTSSHDDNLLSFSSTVANQAMIAHWVTSGHRPDLSAIPPDTPAELIDIMKRCWDEEPTKRPRFQGNILLKYLI